MYLIFSRLEKKLKQKLRSIALLWTQSRRKMLLHTEWDEDKSIEELGTALGPISVLVIWGVKAVSKSSKYDFLLKNKTEAPTLTHTQNKKLKCSLN